MLGISVSMLSLLQSTAGPLQSTGGLLQSTSGPVQLAAGPLQSTVDPVLFVVVAFVVFLGGAVIAPLVLLSVRDTREPTVDERERLKVLAETAGYEPPEVHVIDTVGDHSVEVSIRGPPGKRSLLVTDYVLAELDSETAAALLAAEAGRSKLLYIEYRALAAASVIGIATGMFGGLIPFSDGLFILAVAALALFWVGRRLQFAADRLAADQVGAESLATAFETVATLQGVEPEGSTWRTWFEVQPPLGQRIDRLRDRS